MMNVTKIWMTGIAALFLASSALAAERTYINGSAANGNGPPFSGAVLAGETLYLSGVIGHVNGKVPEDPADEARVALDAIKGTLKQAGMTMDDLVSVQVFCSDVKYFGTFNRVYRTYFTEMFPARAFVGSGPLLLDARFEVMAIAVKR